VRKIAPSGTSTVIATAFTSPWGIAVDSNGNVLVADHATNVISKLTPNSSGTSYTQSTFLKAGTLVSPVEMGIDAGNNLYVADRGNNRIVVVGPGKRRWASYKSIVVSKPARALRFFEVSSEFILPRPSSMPMNHTGAEHDRTLD